MPDPEHGTGGGLGLVVATITGAIGSAAVWVWRNLTRADRQTIKDLRAQLKEVRSKLEKADEETDRLTNNLFAIKVELAEVSAERNWLRISLKKLEGNAASRDKGG